MKVFTVAAAVLCTVSSVAAWGADGHRMVGDLAQRLLSSRASTVVKAILGGTGSLAVASTWADEIKSNKAYAWASELHYSDATDNPPTTCNYNDARDCPTGRCVTGAIRNYTTILSTVSDYGSVRAAEALKFLVHFVSDIHQPLHLTGRDVGGNNSPCTFFGASTNLHSLWDTGIITRNIKEAGSAANYLADLILLQDGPLAVERAAWLKCKNNQRYLACPEEWANPIDQLNCEIIYKGFTNNIAYSQTYYDKATPIIQRQMVMAAVRLAGILNALF